MCFGFVTKICIFALHAQKNMSQTGMQNTLLSSLLLGNTHKGSEHGGKHPATFLKVWEGNIII